mgnify:CR=1 FL=1
MIETRLMQYFLAVAKEQNITKAAKSAAHHTAYFKPANGYA